MEDVNQFFREVLIEDETIFYNEGDYHKQKDKEKRNPVFKRNKPKKF